MGTDSFRDAQREIIGDSWLDDLARMSLSAADAKFSPRTEIRIDGPGEPDTDGHYG